LMLRFNEFDQVDLTPLRNLNFDKRYLQPRYLRKKP